MGQKLLRGPPPIWEPSTFGGELQARWLIEDANGLVKAHQVFEDCDILGPAVIWMKRAWLEDCTIILEDGHTTFLQLEADLPASGVITLNDCVFRRCRFHQIGIAGSVEELERFRTRLRPA